MYLGNWETSKYYNRGNIVFIVDQQTYYICSISHMSNNLIYPNKEDIFWIQIDNNFTIDNTKIYKPDICINYGDFINDNKNFEIRVPAKEEIEMVKQKRKKRKRLETIETKIVEYKNTRIGDEIDDIREKILLLNVDIGTKAFVLDKYETTKTMSGSEYAKGISWLKTITNIPYGKIKPADVGINDSTEKLQKFFTKIKTELDYSIYGLEDVKQEIIEYVARRITNPKGKGDVLALCGPKGTGKTKLIRSLAKALDLPFFQINCGGLNDVAILTGHSETYIGSKPGKIVDCFQQSEYMNPIIYLDEIDKISERRSDEINGFLTHLLDEEQNKEFQDNYLGNVNIDLSKVLFVISFNDISKVDEIVSDRMKIMYLKTPTLEDKVIICKEKVIPDIISNINSSNIINMTEETLTYTITKKCEIETGIRQLKKTLEKIFNRINYDILTDNLSGNINKNMIEKDEKNNKIYTITISYIDKILQQKETQNFMSMYI